MERMAQTMCKACWLIFSERDCSAIVISCQNTTYPLIIASRAKPLPTMPCRLCLRCFSERALASAVRSASARGLSRWPQAPPPRQFARTECTELSCASAWRGALQSQHKTLKTTSAFRARGVPSQGRPEIQRRESNAILERRDMITRHQFALHLRVERRSALHLTQRRWWRSAPRWA